MRGLAVGPQRCLQRHTGTPRGAMGGNGGSPAPLASASRRSSGGGGSPRASGDVVPGAPPLAVSPGGKPTLILDIMDTVVQDPFFEHMPRFFDLSFHELLAAKHPTAWVEFEKAQITEQQLFDKFFQDGRGFDGPALVEHMIAHYSYVDGMAPLLARLRDAGYAMHAMSNYPEWWRHIEAKLAVSDFMQWSFVSCEGPMKGLRKPAAEAYQVVTSSLGVPPPGLIFVDDRRPNVDAAAALGWGAVHFTGAADLEDRLRAMGLEF